MTKKRVSDEQIIEAISKSSNIKNTLTLLGMAICGGNYNTIHRCIARHNIDISHFIKGFQPGHKSTTELPDDKVFIENGKYSRSKLKSRIIQKEIIPYVCSRCGISEWQGEKLSLHLDHTNGIRNDDRLENLRFLCPNCHSLTETYCGKNNKKFPKDNFCECGKKIYKDSKRCVSCMGKTRIKISWPSEEDLLEMLKTYSFVAVGKQLGVSNNAIKAHLKKRGIDPKTIRKA